jgi:hypothetical protein
MKQASLNLLPTGTKIIHVAMLHQFAAHQNRTILVRFQRYALD